MTDVSDAGSSWTELRYTSSQALPEPDGIRDELDGIVLWNVEAVRCFHDRPAEVVARAEVAVFDLESGLDLRAPATAYGDGIRVAAELVLTPGGALRPELGFTDVDAFVLFQQSVIGQGARGSGLMATLLIRDRVGSRRSLVGSLPNPPTALTTRPEFFRGVPESVQQHWWDRGLFHHGRGLWLLPPDGQAPRTP